jgi:hypothetical protein
VKAFADLLDRLSYSPSRNAKLRLMADYFRTAPDPDRGWALAALTDCLPFSFPLRRTLTEMMDRRMDPVLFRLSRTMWAIPRRPSRWPGLVPIRRYSVTRNIARVPSPIVPKARRRRHMGKGQWWEQPPRWMFSDPSHPVPPS